MYFSIFILYTIYTLLNKDHYHLVPNLIYRSTFFLTFVSRILYFTNMALISYYELFNLLRTQGKNLKDHESLLEMVLANNSFNFSECARNHLHEPLRLFCKHLYEKWCNANRTYEHFIKKHQTWLDKKFNIPKEVLEISSAQVGSSKPVKTKPFSQLSNKQKKRRTETLRTNNNADELAFATKINMQQSGNKDISKILSYLTDNPGEVSKIWAFCKGKSQCCEKTYSREKALALMISLNLSKSKYIQLRMTSMEHGVNLYPSYYQIQLAKKDCYPSKEMMTFTETHAEIELQALLDLTIQRLWKALEIDTNEKLQDLKLISKWGFDGASGQSFYKQGFTDNIVDINKPRDESVFTISLVPLKLLSGDKIVWENPQPSSTKFCRPIKFEFIKESDEIIRREKGYIENKINNLFPSHLNGDIVVRHELLLTMIDGKACSSIAESSSMNCYICGATPKQMNSFDIVQQRTINMNNLKFGMSSLHGWIRCMEFLLHVSYNLEIQKWSVRAPQQKILKLERKKNIQEQFRRKLGLLIDVVKQGVGTSNDGNTARRFFENPSVTAEITGLDEIIIRKFSILLQAIASGEEIDPEKFDIFAKDLAKVVIEKYGWYYMPASVHKILFHGANIIRHVLLPIGQLSEEVIEARHKEFRRFRLNNARKKSRRCTNEDIMFSLLISSDPYISNLRHSSRRKSKKNVSRNF